MSCLGPWPGFTRIRSRRGLPDPWGEKEMDPFSVSIKVSLLALDRSVGWEQGTRRICRLRTMLQYTTLHIWVFGSGVFDRRMFGSSHAGMSASPLCRIYVINAPTSVVVSGCALRAYLLASSS